MKLPSTMTKYHTQSVAYNPNIIAVHYNNKNERNTVIQSTNMT